jgi:integrase
MFNFGIEEETFGLESNPADRLGKHRNPEQGRDRWLSLDEIKRYWTALDGERPIAVAALRLCLLTAQRQANVLGMRLDQLALEDRLWIIPAITTKTGRSYKVPLSAAAVAVIEARIKELAGAGAVVTWLFSGKRGVKLADTTLTRSAHRATCKRANIDNYKAHDHRHTFATHCEQMGISRLIWDGILGHSANGMADLYSGHDFAEQRLDCMERWADRIAATLADNVVPIKQDASA